MGIILGRRGEIWDSIAGKGVKVGGWWEVDRVWVELGKSLPVRVAHKPFLFQGSRKCPVSVFFYFEWRLSCKFTVNKKEQTLLDNEPATATTAHVSGGAGMELKKILDQEGVKTIVDTAGTSFFGGGAL